MGVEHPILIFRRKSVEWFPSMSEAERVTGIRRARLVKALSHPCGEVEGIYPYVYVDTPIREATEEELEEYWKNAKSKH